MKFASILLPSTSLLVQDLHSVYSEVQLTAAAPGLNVCVSYIARGVMNFHEKIQFIFWNCIVYVNCSFTGEVLKSH